MKAAFFGEYIRKIRRDKGLTLTQLAAQLKPDSANLSRIENGKREFDEKRLNKLAIALNLNIEELKNEYFGDCFAKKLYEYKCSHDALLVAEEKVNYLKRLNTMEHKKIPMKIVKGVVNESAITENENGEIDEFSNFKTIETVKTNA